VRIVLLAAAALGAIGCAEGYAVSDAPPPRKHHTVDGAALYAERCALCHGDEGQGYVADNANALANPEFLSAASDDFLRSSIEHGRSGTPMSAWGAAVGGPLDVAQLTAIVQYIRRFASVQPVDVESISVTGSAVRAKSYYDVKCKSCHGAEGRGGEYMTIATPEFLAIASDGYLRQAIREGRPGTPMQAFAGMLADQVIDDLVVLIRSWQVDPEETLPAAPVWPAEPIQHPDGAEPAFGDDRFVAVDTVHAELESGARMLLADARPPTDYVADHIAGAVNVPFYDAEKYVDKLPTDVTIVAYCGCPHAASGALADRLEKQNFEHVKVLDEGYFVWRDKGYAVVPGPTP
jgi:cytochrome c oxidase cbb3-type subunit 3